MKIGVLEPDHFSLKAIELLSKYGEVFLYDGIDLQGFLSDKTALFCRLKYFFNKDILQYAPKLKWICSPTTGLNHIDFEYCERNAIKIISLKGETNFLNTIAATPEHTLGLILALYRNYSSAFLNNQNKSWDREKNRGFEIKGSKIGLIGYGRVARLTSTYLNAMGAEIGFCDLKEPDLVNAKLLSFSTIQELIEFSDCIVLTASYIPENGVVLTKEMFEYMKGKYFVNTARAELTDEMALLELLHIGGYFKGVAIDVLQNEQSENNNLSELLTLTRNNNLIITPHIGGATFDSMKRTEEFIAQKLIAQL